MVKRMALKEGKRRLEGVVDSLGDLRLDEMMELRGGWRLDEGGVASFGRPTRGFTRTASSCVAGARAASGKNMPFDHR